MPFARPMSGPASRGQTALIAASSSAAQLRGVLPMGVWSTSSTRSMCRFVQYFKCRNSNFYFSCWDIQIFATSFSNYSGYL